MVVRLSVVSRLPEKVRRAEKGSKKGAMTAARRFSTLVKVRFREDVIRAGLGSRLANTWRDAVYPDGGRESLRPAVFIASNAPAIIRGHTEGSVIRHRSGMYLAIPTQNTPRKGRKLASPQEVESIFNQDLIFLPGSGGNLLAFVDAVRAKSGRGFRQATQRRVGSGRRKELVLMFVFVRQVRLRKRLDWPRIADDLAGTWRDMLSTEVAKGLDQA